MNLLANKNTKAFRNAILNGHTEKARKLLQVHFGKPDVFATSEDGKFTMLHCACLTGNIVTVMFALQLGIDINALSWDGYTALDIAIWKNHEDVIDLLRVEGGIAPMKEPKSLNGKHILHLDREALVYDYTNIHSDDGRYQRAVHYLDGENRILDLWRGEEYRILDELPSENQRRLSMTMENLDTSVVEVPPGPLGVLLDGECKSFAVVQGFTKLPDGSCGAIEHTKLIIPGMRIVSIDDEDTSIKTLAEVTAMLAGLSKVAKKIGFCMVPLINVNSETSSEEDFEWNKDMQQSTSFTAKQIAQCAHCGMPIDLHETEACPYK